MKEIKINTAGFLILKLLLFTLICSCSSSRYTSFKSFVSGPPHVKEKVEKEVTPATNMGFNEINETAQLAAANDYFEAKESSEKEINPQPKIIKPVDQKKENRVDRKKWEDDYYQKRRKPFRLMEYDESGLKYNKVFASIAVSTGFMWIAGFFLAGVGTVMFVFFGASVISGLLSLIKRR
jgi:hypothetical protein